MKAILFFTVLFTVILTSCSTATEEQKNQETIVEKDKKVPEKKSDTEMPKENLGTEETKPKPQNTATPINVGDADFDKTVLKSDKIVLVDFWATWCKPCLMIAPVMKELASEYAENIIVAKLDVDKNPQTAAKYDARAIPLILIFKNGKIVDKIMGAFPKAEYKSRIDKAIGS